MNNFYEVRAFIENKTPGLMILHLGVILCINGKDLNSSFEV